MGVPFRLGRISFSNHFIIQIDDDITVEQLSEGEKKLILVKTVLEILSDEKLQPSKIWFVNL